MNRHLLNIIDAIIDPRIMDDDGELQTVTGYYRGEYHLLRETVSGTRGLYVLRGDAYSMIMAAINNLAGYPHGQTRLVSEIVGITRGDDNVYGRLYELIVPHIPAEKLKHRR